MELYFHVVYLKFYYMIKISRQKSIFEEYLSSLLWSNILWNLPFSHFIRVLFSMVTTSLVHLLQGTTLRAFRHSLLYTSDLNSVSFSYCCLPMFFKKSGYSPVYFIITFICPRIRHSWIFFNIVRILYLFEIHRTSHLFTMTIPCS